MKKFISIVVCLIVVIIAVVAFVSKYELNAAGRTITFTAPTTNEDGTPLTDLAGYKVYCDADVVDIGNVTVHILSKSCQLVWVTAYDTSGNESMPSNQLDTMAPASVTIRFQ